MRFAAALVSLFLCPGAFANGLERLAPHRAVYDVTLEDASERSGITGIKGRMVYEMRGSVCDGFSTRFRFFQNVRTPRREYTSDQRTTTFEAADGSRYDFVNRTFFNGSEEKEVKGSAVREKESAAQEGGELEVSLEQPDAAELTLPAAIFPAAHLAAIIDAASAGKRFLAADVFDGSDDGDALMATNAVIGRVNSTDAPGGVIADAAAKLERLRSWPVNVAYFEGDADARGERLPVYQVAFPLYENGVSGNLSMSYDDYQLKAKLADLEYLDASDCDPGAAKN